MGGEGVCGRVSERKCGRVERKCVDGCDRNTNLYDMEYNFISKPVLKVDQYRVG